MNKTKCQFERILYLCCHLAADFSWRAEHLEI